MKILLISVQSTVSRGGIAVWTDRFLSKCADHNIECTLVNTEIVGKRATQSSAKRNITDEFVRTRRILKDLKQALKQDFDAAHLNTSCGNFGLFRDYLIARQIKKKGIPLITHYHCDIPYWIHNKLNRKCLEKWASTSDKNLVLCENSKRYLQKQFGIDSVKVPNFIEETVILDMPKAISQTAQKVFFVGRVSEAKGATEMYELANRFPELTFELVGNVSPSVAAWDKPENVQLLGGFPHDQVMQRLDAADIFLFPSHSEGFSVALLESMARGVPAIATDVGAAADMLADGCGIVVEKQNVDAMAMALRALDKTETREGISRRAVNKCREQYTIDAVIDLIKKQYK